MCKVGPHEPLAANFTNIIVMDCFQLIHIAGVVVLTQMLLHPELYEEKYFETYGTAPRSGKYLISQHVCVGF